MTSVDDIYSWILYKLFPKNTRTHEALKFLLDHPRRCFIALFPSPQTWLLFFVLCVMKCALRHRRLPASLTSFVSQCHPILRRLDLEYRQPSHRCDTYWDADSSVPLILVGCAKCGIPRRRRLLADPGNTVRFLSTVAIVRPIPNVSSRVLYVIMMYIAVYPIAMR